MILVVAVVAWSISIKDLGRIVQGNYELVRVRVTRDTRELMFIVRVGNHVKFYFYHQSHLMNHVSFLLLPLPLAAVAVVIKRKGS